MCASSLDERPRSLCSGVLERDSDELEATASVSLMKLLPPGQLLATPSPRSPEEQEDTLAAQRNEVEYTRIEARECSRRKLVTWAQGPVRSGHCHTS